MTPHNLTLSALQREGVIRACTEYNKFLSRDEQGILLNALTPDEFHDKKYFDMVNAWAQQHCSCSGFDLSQRFTPQEYGLIIAAGKTDPQVAGFLARLSDPAPINVTSPAFWGALAYLVDHGLLAEDRVDEIAGISGDSVTIGVTATEPTQSLAPSIWRRLFGWLR